MPCPKSVVSVLCTVLLVSVVTVGAHPYYSESSYLDGNFNRHMNALSMQAGQACPASGACEVCQTAQIGSRDLHICPGDGDRCNPTPCIYTSACRCSSRALQLPPNLLKCNSSTTVVIEGVSVKINEYIMINPGPDRDEPCFTTEPLIDTCTGDCNGTCSPVEICTNHTLTGDLTSCNGDGCVCSKPGYLQPTCCKCDIESGLYYLPDCDSVCRQNCARPRPGQIGGCAACHGGFEPPSCCNCTEGKQNIDGVCKCEPNYKTDGSGECIGGFVPPDCCECPANKNSIDGRCVCESNYKTDGSGECTGGFVPPDCCECPADKNNINGRCESESDCNSDKNIYFLLDGTRQNSAFCTLGITIQMLVAALNPDSSSSGIKLSTVLFPNYMGEANVVFNTGNTCDEIKSKLSTLQTQMQTCQDIQQPDKSSITYTSLCGQDTTAVAGLDKIRSLIPKPATTESAVVILTDGVIDDPDSEVNRAFTELSDSSLRVKSIITAGIQDSKYGATDANLRHYTRKGIANDRVVLAYDAVNLGIGLMEEMNSVGLICPDLANRIITELRKINTDVNVKNTFCQCHNTRILSLLDRNNRKCVVGYPICGGSLSISADAVPKQQESLNLEEEILAAVENVLERFEE